MFISWAGPFYRIAGGRNIFWFEDHKWCGPMRVDQKGEPENGGVFPERSPFWPLHQKWIESGKRVDEKGNCLYDELGAAAR